MHHHVHLLWQHSPYSPLAFSFFGLGTGYLIMGGRTLFQKPESSEPVERSIGIWSVCVPGVIQTISASVILIGMTWFPAFATDKKLYFLGLAFLGFATHWLAMGFVRFFGASKAVEGWMALPFMVLCALGVTVLWAKGDIPLVIAFCLLFLVYTADGVRAVTQSEVTLRVQGLAQFITGWWLMYLVWAVVLMYVGIGSPGV